MAPILPSLRPALALFLVLLFHIDFARAYFWTATTNYMISSSVSTYTYRSTSFDYYTRATTRTIKKGVTPTGSILSATTSSDIYYDIQYIKVYYASGAVADSDLSTTSSYDPNEYYSTTSTYYYMDVSWTAPASCPTRFTYKTSVSVNIPSAVSDQVTPKSTAVGTPITYASYVRPYVTAYLSDGSAPFNTTSAFVWRYYITSCSSPYSSASTTSRSSGSGGSSRTGGNTSWTVCSWYTGCTSLKTWIIVIATLLPTIFVLGFLESWFWFRRLMLGKSCLRLGTVCWIFLSLWVACFTRKQGSRSKEDQLLLREKWNALSGRTAFKLWFKHGFRHSYPTELLGTYSKTSVGVPGVLPTAANGVNGTGPDGGALSKGPDGSVTAIPPPQMQQQQPLYYQVAPGQFVQQPFPPQQPYPQHPQTSYSAVSPVSSNVPTAVPTPQPVYSQPSQTHTQYYDPAAPALAVDPNAPVTTVPTPPPQAHQQSGGGAPLVVPQELQQPGSPPPGTQQQQPKP